MSRAEPSWVMVIGAQEVECAEWSGALRGLPSRRLELPIAPHGDEPPDAAMRQAVNELAKSFVEGGAATIERSSTGRLTVLVSDRWVALTTVPWGPALMRKATQDRFLRSHLEAAGFETKLTDTVRMDDESAFGRPRIAVAYPATLTEALSNAALTLGGRLESVQPLEVAVARLLRSRLDRRPGALAIVDRERLRFMHLAPDGMTAGQSLVDPALTGDRSGFIETVWRRQQLRDAALEKCAPLQVLDLAGDPRDEEAAPSPAIRAARAVSCGSSLNGSQPSHRQGAASWLVAAACLLLAIALGVHAFRMSNAARGLELAAERRTSPPTPTTREKWTREESTRIRAVNAAIREINLPIGALLGVLKPPRDIRVALLGVTVEGANATLKLSAEAASGAEMARYVGYLAERPALLRAYLVSHIVDETDAVHPYRFNVEVAWRE